MTSEQECISQVQKQIISKWLGSAPVFQAETYATLQCASETNRKATENNRVHIISEVQATLNWFYWVRKYY